MGPAPAGRRSRRHGRGDVDKRLASSALASTPMRRSTSADVSQSRHRTLSHVRVARHDIPGVYSNAIGGFPPLGERVRPRRSNVVETGFDGTLVGARTSGIRPSPTPDSTSKADTRLFICPAISRATRSAKRSASAAALDAARFSSRPAAHARRRSRLEFPAREGFRLRTALGGVFHRRQLHTLSASGMRGAGERRPRPSRRRSRSNLPQHGFLHPADGRLDYRIF